MVCNRPILSVRPWGLLLWGLLPLGLFLLQNDPRTQLLMRNTLLLAAGVCAISLPLGTLLAVLLVRTDLPGRRAALVLLGALLFVPLYLQAAGWDAGFGQQGWYSLVAGSATSPWLAGWRAAVWIHAMAAVPWVVLLVGVGLRLVEPELEEQALLDASPAWVFVHVTLRRAASWLGVAALWVLISTAGEMTVTDVYGVRTYAEELYTGYAWGDELSDAGLAVLPGLLLLGWLVLAALLLAGQVAPADPWGLPRPPWTFRLGRWRWAALVPVLLALLLVAGVPLGNLLYKAGLVVEQVGVERLRYWSGERFAEVVVPSGWRFRRELGSTLLIAVVTASLALLVATPLAWWARRGGWRTLPALLTASAGLALPGPLIALAVIWLLNRDHHLLIWLYDRTIFAPALAALVRSLPLALIIVWYALRSVRAELLESASLEGAGPLTRLRRIALPLCAPALLLAWLVSLAITAGDLAASILVVPPGVTTIAIRVFGLLHAGVDDQVAGICLNLAAGFALIAAVALWLVRRGPVAGGG